MAEVADVWFHRLKGGARDLVKLCGGVIRAGEVASRSKSEVSRWQTVTDPAIIDLPAALALESDCGVPVITTVMAEMHGRRLTDEAAASSAASILERHADLMRCSAEVSAAVAAALADHTITPAEAELIDRACAEKEVAMRVLRAGLAAVKAEGAAGAGAPLRPLRAV